MAKPSYRVYSVTIAAGAEPTQRFHPNAYGLYLPVGSLESNLAQIDIGIAPNEGTDADKFRAVEGFFYRSNIPFGVVRFYPNFIPFAPTTNLKYIITYDPEVWFINQRPIRLDSSGNVPVAINSFAGSIALPAIQLSSTVISASFTAAAQTSSTNTVPSGKYLALQVKGLGGVPTLWDVRLEAAVDNLNGFTTLLTHATADGDGVTKVLSTPAAARIFRLRCAAVTLGPASSLDVDANVAQ